MKKSKNNYPHPLSNQKKKKKKKSNGGYNSYRNDLGTSGDFSQYDIVDDKFNGEEDFGSDYGSGDYAHDQFVMGDFANFAADCNYGEENMQGFEDEMIAGYGDYDDGLGRRRWKPKIKIKPKALVRAVSKVAKVATKPAFKAIAAAKKLSPIPLPIPTSLKPKDFIKDLKKFTPKGIMNQAQGAIAKAMSLIPAKKQEAEMEPSEIISQDIPVSEAQVASQGIAPVEANAIANQVIATAVKADKIYHPMVSVHKKIKGEPMAGFFDDIKATINKAATTAYQQNKSKLISAGTAQLTNIVGKKLDSLSKTSPAAQQAINTAVASAAAAGAVAAQDTALQKAKTLFEQNKKTIMIGAGVGLAALIAYNMMKKK